MTSHQNITAIPLKRKKWAKITPISPEIITMWEELSNLSDWISCSCISQRFKAGPCTIASAGIAALQFWAHWMQCSGAAVTSWEPVIADAGGVAAGRGEKYQGGSEGRRRKERSFGGMGRWKRGLPWLWTACCSTPSDLSHRVFLCQLGRIVKAINEDEKYHQRWRYTAKTIASIYC